MQRVSSYTYAPLFGIKAAADNKGRLSFYEYDKLGRLTVVRDQDGNIINKTEYRVQSAD